SQERGPALLNVNAAGDTLFVVDNANNRILVYSPQIILALHVTNFPARLQTNGQIAIQWETPISGDLGRFELQYGTTPAALNEVLDASDNDPSRSSYTFYHLHPAAG